MLRINEKNLNEGVWIALPNDPTVKFKVLPVTPAMLREMRLKYTQLTFDKKSREKILTVDPEKQREELEKAILDSVLGWEGIVKVDEAGNDKDVPFSRENLKDLLDKVGNLKVEEIWNEETGEQEKLVLTAWLTKQIFDSSNFIGTTENLPPTSQPGKTITGIGGTEKKAILKD